MSSSNPTGEKTVTTHSFDRNRWPSARTWTRDQIRAARTAPLAPLLQQRGVQLMEREAGFALPAYPGLLLKDSCWRWPERNQAANAIDFFVQVTGMSFHDAMRQITGT